jgi:hypothetical protein
MPHCFDLVMPPAQKRVPHARSFQFESYSLSDRCRAPFVTCEIQNNMKPVPAIEWNPAAERAGALRQAG